MLIDSSKFNFSFFPFLLNLSLLDFLPQWYIFRIPNLIFFWSYITVNLCDSKDSIKNTAEHILIIKLSSVFLLTLFMVPFLYDYKLFLSIFATEVLLIFKPNIFSISFEISKQLYKFFISSANSIILFLISNFILIFYLILSSLVFINLFIFIIL